MSPRTSTFAISTLSVLFMSLALTLAVTSCSKTVATSPANHAASNAPSNMAPAADGESSQAAARRAPATPAQPAGAVLGHVEFQNHRVTIHGGADGPRYTLADSAGETMAQTLTGEQFAARYPELFQAFEQAQARTLDATATEAMDSRRGRR